MGENTRWYTSNQEVGSYGLTYEQGLFAENNLLSHINEIRNLHLYDRPAPARPQTTANDRSVRITTLNDHPFKNINPDSEIDDSFRNASQDQSNSDSIQNLLSQIEEKDSNPQKEKEIADLAKKHAAMLKVYEAKEAALKDAYRNALVDISDKFTAGEILDKYDQDREQAKREIKELKAKHQREMENLKRK
jgi:hypothetical protein